MTSPFFNVVYKDDQYSSVDVIGNILYNSPHGVIVGGGRDNIIRNNIFINISTCLQIDARGFAPAPNNTFNLLNNLQAVPYQDDVWAKAYPKLVNILNDDPHAPKGNEIVFNLISGKSSTSIAAMIYTNSTYQNNTFNVPSNWFSNPNALNFTLIEGNPYESANFARIPFGQIGLIPWTSNVVPAVSSTVKPITSQNRTTSPKAVASESNQTIKLSYWMAVAVLVICLFK